MTKHTTSLIEKFGLTYLTSRQSQARDRKHARQREKWGFCDADLWSLFQVIVKFVLPRLIRFRKMPRMGYPQGLSEKRWDRILDQMIMAFQVLEKDEIKNKKSLRIVQRGLKLFAEWFEHLWD